MLKILRRIIQDVNAAQTLSEALDIVVSGVKQAMHIDACCIFLIDEAHGENVLVAADGLNKSLVKKVRLKLGEGLIGLVGERAEPINISHAASHPSYIHYPDSGEEFLKAFLGVPIIHQRHVLGVLIIYQTEERCFDEAEEAFLVTLSAQLSGIIAHALATGNIFGQDKTQVTAKGKVLTGIVGASGIAMGKAHVIYRLADISAVPERKIQPEEVAAEIGLFETALVAARQLIRSLEENMAAHGLPEEERALFDAYLRILESKSFVQEIIAEINKGNWAQGALKIVTTRHISRFEDMDDAYLKERAADLKDLAERVLFYLQSREMNARHFPEKTILVGEEVTPAALAEVPEGKLAGIVSGKGSTNSHIAILARALGIPTVLGVEGIKVTELEEKELIVDGYYGQVHCSPSAVVRHEFAALICQERDFDNQLQLLRDLPTETLDGYSIKLYVNTGLSPDVNRALSVGAEGVGLYRTEVPFMTRDRFPSEEEQRVIYRQLLQAFLPKPVVMRTLDVGGDKDLAYFPIIEDNPFLGWRGIRITLDHPEIFLVQLRAMLQASLGLDNLQIMFPMVTTIAEVEETLRLFRQAFEEVVAEGLAIKKPALGVMVEVPSAVYQAQSLAKRVDFLSVGSNDLTQYLLAVDRNNARVANLYNSFHPAVLRALLQVVAGAHREAKMVSICGEMANDPVAAVLLLAMGFDALSMNATGLLQVKWIIRKLTMQHAKRLLEEVLQMDDAVEIQRHMEQALEEAGLDSVMRMGK
jgi:phosphotransferase system enzyme I (PtsP)